MPWRLIGERVRVVVSGGRVRVHHGPDVVAEHVEHTGHHARVTDCAHLVGVNGARARPRPQRFRPKPELLREMAVDHDTLAGWLTRLQLTAIRDQLDNLLAEAVEKKLTLGGPAPWSSARARMDRTRETLRACSG